MVKEKIGDSRTYYKLTLDETQRIIIYCIRFLLQTEMYILMMFTHRSYKLKEKEEKECHCRLSLQNYSEVFLQICDFFRGHLDECSDYLFCRYLVKETVPQDL